VAKANLQAKKSQVEYIEKRVQDKLADKLELKAAQELLPGLQDAVELEESRKKQLKDTDPDLAVQLAKDAYDDALLQLDLAKIQRNFCTLKAPEAGWVLRINVRPGQLWNPYGAFPAMQFRPDRPWTVRCEIDQIYATKVKPGMPCDIFDDRLDKSTWKGTVQSCSDWIAPRRVDPNDPAAFHDVRTMECIIRLDETKDVPRVGQRVRVVIRSTAP
jgi:multidrug resistance efflux pump